MKSKAGVERCATGSAILVPRGNLTDGKHALAPCTWAMAVHAALATKLAHAIRFSLCSLKWQQSGTTLATPAHPLTTQLAHAIEHGGSMTRVAAFKPESMHGHMCASHSLITSRLTCSRYVH